MKSIRIKDLEIVEQERQQEESTEKNTAAALAQLTIENKKKDLLITQLTQTIANLNIEIAKLKGGVS
ncbi:hypothetical protein NSQ51_13380 [Geobacillus sp. FSL K6-0789]|uniref:Uncharacterized protein n=1 Tax=Geobacillus stearothermophilus TaxID=1422 RepID=A0A3L7DDJ9_GEOSE|nr:hypothetical protein [Geobacillus stearothermophilus]RLQ08635.1 hypothetical protein D9549_07025 [Geobacillus stearothermophilus]RLQ10704.1 hypothetical protein D9547_07055 [Geobacillus stearothermophilus]RLQ14052.1 hypothetical protein D9548_08040 [Geobacillus stearothermophilus]